MDGNTTSSVFMAKKFPEGWKVKEEESRTEEYSGSI
jgi:hypothetical protein